VAIFEFAGTSFAIAFLFRLPREIDMANEQLRNGQNHVPGPGVCVIYHKDLEASGDEMFLAALFGDLTVPIDLNPTRMGTTFLGRNGILSVKQNRGISAVRYVRGDADV
jgi:hypothetical protein